MGSHTPRPIDDGASACALRDDLKSNPKPFYDGRYLAKPPLLLSIYEGPVTRMRNMSALPESPNTSGPTASRVSPSPDTRYPCAPCTDKALDRSSKEQR